jgi:Ca-activated chloride channel homolog
MRLLFFMMLLFGYGQGFGQLADPTPALNHSVELINRTVGEVEGMMHSLQTHYEDVRSWKAKKSTSVRSIAATGATEEYYYRKALEESRKLAPATQKKLLAPVEAFWKSFGQLDEQYKALEVYLRLGDYRSDGMQGSERMLAAWQQKLVGFREARAQLVQTIRQIYATSGHPANAYTLAEKKMNAVIAAEEALLAAWTYNFEEAVSTGWPVEKVQQNVSAQESALAAFRKEPEGVEYPASSMYKAFGEAMSGLQKVKRTAIDEYNAQARQSDRHANKVYLNLLNHFNNDLLAFYNQFVSSSQKPLLMAPKFCPLFEIRTRPQTPETASVRFDGAAIPEFSVMPQKSPISSEAFALLNHAVDFLNESVRSIQYLQTVLRNLQSSAPYYRSLTSFQGKGGLSFSTKEYLIPRSFHQQAKIPAGPASPLPAAYQQPLNAQLDALLTLEEELESLNTEMEKYCQEKGYEKDRFGRFDQMTDRYMTLLEAFDQRKQHLYEDVRRIFESHPSAQPTSSWVVSGKGMGQLFELDYEALKGVKLYLKGKQNNLPATDQIESQARLLIEKEYQNMNGLKRYGRSNGLCPYTPYEDLAADSRRFAEKVSKVKIPAQATDRPPSMEEYESLIYFYNNELVEAYNKFCELSAMKLLRQVRQPFLLIPIRVADRNPKPTALAQQPTVVPVPPEAKATLPVLPSNEPPASTKEKVIHDTIYIERTRVDTVFVHHTSPGSTPFGSMEGYAYNNLVLLLDVSASMNSPHKLPLLKKSMKSLLRILRPEDEIAIVVYSGKAKVLLEPTSGKETEKLSRIIDELESEGNTDANGGIRLAYRVADKNYLRGGNNRIILATDGEFSISPALFDLVRNGARQDIFLSVFDYDSKATAAHILQKLAELGKGNFSSITTENSDLKLVTEAKAKLLK